MVKKPFLDALPVIEEIEAAGFEAFFVGGAVRDNFLNRPIGDVDIATSARPEQIKTIFSRTVDIGIEHGTVLVLFKGESYEITTYRTETGYKDFRRPDEVKFVTSLTEDLMRRDFTINAMAMDRHGVVIDPFGGKEDIVKKQIRTVGNPVERFSEDALRIMRAIRFVSQLRFSIEKGTLSSLSEAAHLLTHIAVERKSVEFEKILQGTGRAEGIRMITEAGILDYLPGLSGRKTEISKLSSYQISNLNLNEMWALLLYCISIEQDGVDEFLRVWKLPVKKIKAIAKLLYFFQQRLQSNWDLRLLYQAGKENIISVEKLIQSIGGQAGAATIEKWVEMHNSLPIKSSDEMDVSGGDLVKWSGKTGGPWVKEQLAMVEDAIIHGQLDNRKDKIKEWLFNCNQR
ncbi:CCA tRNA nucleotidyltransferase [Bacillus sp. EB01]|uniref:CCA tRNA nucleotidyltransferase n=1 Tax=Bacillus sp. EB01 TaxID=1347086 RepID=UPI0009DEF20E|nr:CCA tRNA nucleotidyltransferase [Bacillus sp. EB01]